MGTLYIGLGLLRIKRRVNGFVEEKLKNVELAWQLKPPRDEGKTMPLIVATTSLLQHEFSDQQK